MSIAVSVLTTSLVARNNFGAARQESAPQSATEYSFGRSQAMKTNNLTSVFCNNKTIF